MNRVRVEKDLYGMWRWLHYGCRQGVWTVFGGEARTWRETYDEALHHVRAHAKGLL